MSKMLKNFFFKDDEEETPTKKESPKPSKVKVSSTIPTSVPSFQSSSSIGVDTIPTSQLNDSERQQFAEHLNKVFTDRNFPGPDYQEFKSALSRLDNMPMDEATKYASIFAGFAVQNVTKEKLIETAEGYIKIFQKQTADFQAEIDKTINTDLSKQLNSVEALKKENEEIEQHMISLTQKKNKNLEKINSLSAEVSNQTASLQMKRVGFENEANAHISVIASDIEKMKKYIN